MQEAFGGILSLVLIVVFFIIVEGVLGFTVSYTKAFRMKNAVISDFEQYEAAGCGVDDDMSSTACKNKIRSDAKILKYNPPRLSCPKTIAYGDSVAIPVKEVDGMFCAAKINTRTVGGTQYATYRIITQVDIDFPIVKNILGLRLFQVTGDTREIQVNNS